MTVLEMTGQDSIIQVCVQVLIQFMAQHLLEHYGQADF